MSDVDDLLRRRLPAAPGPWPETNERRAAVLAPLLRTPDGDALVFVVRSPRLRLHPGQIGFPGGLDGGDPDPVACALRETHEEIGVAPDLVTLLGRLPHRRSSSGYRVQCIVGRLDAAATLRPDPGEVERMLIVPLAPMLAAGAWSERIPAAFRDVPGIRPSPHFEHEGDVIWGLTGRFCADLVAAIRGLADDR